jgi:hypothetical protein
MIQHQACAAQIELASLDRSWSLPVARLPASYYREYRRCINAMSSIYVHAGFVQMLQRGSTAACLHSVSFPCCQPATARPRLIARGLLSVMPSARIPFISRFQYIPLKTGFDRQMLAPYSSYSAFVWQACWGENNDS